MANKDEARIVMRRLRVKVLKTVTSWRLTLRMKEQTQRKPQRFVLFGDENCVCHITKHSHILDSQQRQQRLGQQRERCNQRSSSLHSTRWRKASKNWWSHKRLVLLRLQTIKAIINSHSFKSPKSDEPRRVQVLDLYCLTRFESKSSSKGIVY